MLRAKVNPLYVVTIQFNTVVESLYEVVILNTMWSFN